MSASLPQPAPVPRVCVLLATHNGLPWLEDQVASILGQVGVDVEILACDDASSDGTRAWLESRATGEPRLRLLPATGRLGNAAANFYHLMRSADTSRHELFALADQDDIWYADKLQRHAALLARCGVDAVSSDVVAFWSDGRRRLIRKSQPQRHLDYLLEPPGPGCSFLMRAPLVRRCADLLSILPAAGLEPLPRHDWFIYIVARREGATWSIDGQPSLDYRQHDRNEVGANVGVRAALQRLASLGRGDYRRLVEQAMELALFIDRQRGGHATSLRLGPLDILRHGRRRWFDAMVAAVFMADGVRASLPRLSTSPESQES